MKSKTTLYPKCSIIILNYFGERVISETLDSVLALDYPKEKLEIIVVDNNSGDRSPQIIQSYADKHDIIIPLLLNTNEGFSAGNNRGIEIASGKYVILLNNDCVVDTGWVKNLIKQPEADPKIFAVNSKIYLFPKFLHIECKLPRGCKEVQVDVRSSLSSYTADDRIHVPIYRAARITYFDIPIHPFHLDENVYVDLQFTTQTSLKELQNSDIFVTKLPQTTQQSFTKQGKRKTITLFFKKGTLSSKSAELYDKIQSTGSIIFSNGSGRDRGALVRHQFQDYEIDKGQYDKPTQIFSACGAASLYRLSTLRKIGYLNENFFMYYEDTELSERAIRAGYILVYEPNAIVRHMHALSSKEWSPFFIYHAERGRLMHMIYHFPLLKFLQEFYEFTKAACARWVYLTIKHKDTEKAYQYIKVCLYIFFKSPRLFIERVSFNNKAKITQQELMNSLYQGVWLIQKEKQL